MNHHTDIILQAQRLRRSLVALFFLLAMLIAASGYFFYRMETASIRDSKINTLKAIADLKNKQLIAWRQERINDTVYNSTGDIQSEVLLWLKTPENLMIKNQLINRLRRYCSREGYVNAFLAGTDGKFLLAAHDVEFSLDENARKLIARAVRSNSVLSGDFYRCLSCGNIHLDIAAPVRNEQEQPITVLILKIDPYHFLYPFIESLPVPSRTGETLLVRKDGDHALFLTSLRHSRSLPLTLQLPLSDKERVEAAAVQGQTGVMEGKDYRDASVVADILPVPGTAWMLITKMDADELFAEVNVIAILTIGYVAALLLLMGFGEGLYYKHITKRMLQERLAVENEKSRLLERSHITLQSIGDAVITTDAEGRVLQMNRVAENLSGWRESEALGKPLPEIFHIINETTRETVENPVDKILSEGVIVGLANHTVLIAKDGSERPIADSGAPIRDTGKDSNGDIIGVVLVFRDQTQERNAQKALQGEKDNLKALLSASPVSLIVLDETARIVELNPASERIAGKILSELSHPSCGDLLGCVNRLEDNRGCGRSSRCASCPLFTAIKNCFTSGASVKDREIKVDLDLSRGGGSRWYRFNIEPVMMGGKPMAIVALIDITDLKQAKSRLMTEKHRLESAVQEAESKKQELRLLLKCAREIPLAPSFADAAKFIIDAVREMTGAQSGYMAMLSTDGMENEILYLDAGGLPCTVDPNLPMPIRGLRQQAYEQGKVVYENHFMDTGWVEFMPKGHVRLDNVMFSPVFMGRDAIGLIGAANKPGGFTDRDAEAAGSFGSIASLAVNYVMRRQEINEWANIFQNAQWGIALLSQKNGYHVKTANPYFARMHGFDLEEIIGMPVHLLAALDSRNILMEQIKQADEGPGHETFLMNSLRKDGIEFPSQTDITLIKGKEHHQYIINILDVSDRVSLESQLVQAMKLESVGRLAGGVAHDFNNMLGVISCHSEMALEDMGPDDPLYASMTAIQDATKRSANVVRQLLAFARKQTANPRILNINDVITSMLSLLQRIIGENITLNWHPDHDIWNILIDPSQVDQILANLLVNARDAISKNGRITIRTANRLLNELFCDSHPGIQPGDYVLLSVADTGSGMEKAVLDRIFEPFFTTKATDKGTGLGLSTVYGIVSQNRGCIDVESAPGKGTVFNIYLPKAVEKETLKTVSSVTEKIQKGGETLLLVEDEEEILNSTALFLGRFGYNVLAAARPGKALEIAAAHAGRIHLLITDVVMPEMNGRELYERILEISPGLKCLYLSGYGDEIISIHGITAPGVHLLPKPFSMKQLNRKIRELVEG